ncbi:transglutaminase domain-containing protein [Mycoplasmopsis bovirhinis]|uniref:Transglutaminase-like domain-containing protein n=1 Tax=Mycoplasmopsis bovirhinis TaxID=29553 RepID=A0A449AFC0_9BACT|nr:transglutaminase domain-containing protein [Mycoplasmopsis bovirhinis]VEU63690.1 Uncharacterised protein [Mycoplasmopsis bovirhinis]
MPKHWRKLIIFSSLPLIFSAASCASSASEQPSPKPNPSLDQTPSDPNASESGTKTPVPNDPGKNSSVEKPQDPVNTNSGNQNSELKDKNNLNNQDQKNDENKETAQDLNKTQETKDQSSQIEPNKPVKDDSKISTEDPNKTNGNKEQTQDTNKKETDKPKTDPVVTQENYQAKYSQLKTEVETFLKDVLKSELKYEYYRDSLNQVINDTDYSLAVKNFKNLNDLYQKQFSTLTTKFNEAKTKYKSAPEVTYTQSDLEQKEGKGKKEDLLSLNYSNAAKENAKINEDSMKYLEFLSSGQIKNYYDDNNPSLIQQLGRDGIAKNRQIIKEKVDSIIKGKDKKMDQVKAVFEWISSNLKYAQHADQTVAIDPVKAMNDLIVVCGGFSNLYKAMLDAINVKSAVVIGWSRFGYHQWNIVYDEDKKQYFHSDATWGKGYYAKTNDEFAKDHRSFEILNAPYEKDGLEYKYYRGFAVSSNKNDKTKETKHVDTINGVNVTSISQEVLKSSERLYIGEFIEKIDYAGGTGIVKSFEVHPNNKHFSVQDGILYNKDKTKLLVIPKSITVKEFTLPNTVREIEDWKQSFDNPNIEKIYVEPGNYWFASYGGILYTNNFERLVFVPNNAGPIVTVHPNATFKEHTFAQLKNIKELIVPEGVKALPQWFVNGVNLTKIHLPASLTDLKEDSLWLVPNNLIVKIADKMNQSVLNVLNKKGYKLEK